MSISGDAPLPPPPGYGYNSAPATPSRPNVDPTFAWTLAFAPLLIAVFPFVIPNLSTGISLLIAWGLNIGLAYADETRLSKVGIKVNSAWVLLVPGYLIVRTMKAGSTPAIPVVWFVTFFVSLAIPGPANNGPVTMDSHQLEQKLVQGMQQQYHIRVKVNCPQNPVVPVGNNFPCNVTARDGSTGQIYVTVTDSDGHYQWQLTQ